MCCTRQRRTETYGLCGVRDGVAPRAFLGGAALASSARGRCAGGGSTFRRRGPVRQMDGVAGLLSSSSNFACDVRLVGLTAKSNDDTLFRTACASIVFAAAAAAAAVALDDVVVDWLGVLLPLPAAFVCCDDAAALLPSHPRCRRCRHVALSTCGRLFTRSRRGVFRLA